MNSDLNEIYEGTRYKHKELGRKIEHFQTENSLLKRKCHALRNQVFKLNNHLENNLRIFDQLGTGTRGLLQMSKATCKNSSTYNFEGFIALHSPILSQNSILNRISELKSVNIAKSCSPQPGPSTASDLNVQQTRNITRRKFHIEPINMEKLNMEVESEMQDFDTQQVNTSAMPEDFSDNRLSTIIEEEEPSSSREVFVKLKRLPSDIVETHLQKQHNFNNSNIYETSLLMEVEPNSSSTPLKMELMQQLGLTPTQRNFNFVSERKKTRSNPGLKSPKKELLSPQPPPRKSINVKENLSPKEKKPKSAKRKKISQEVDTVNKREPRKARPTQLKEVSLMKKLRRS